MPANRLWSRVIAGMARSYKIIDPDIRLFGREERRYPTMYI